MISKPYPRKGTETSIPRREQLQKGAISKPYPRKGTETKLIYPENEAYTQDFKTISPQGDGNISRAIVCTDDSFAISKPYPRKGTETTPSPWG